jgi:hypothetical protein
VAQCIGQFASTLTKSHGTYAGTVTLTHLYLGMTQTLSLDVTSPVVEDGAPVISVTPVTVAATSSSDSPVVSITGTRLEEVSAIGIGISVAGLTLLTLRLAACPTATTTVPAIGCYTETAGATTTVSKITLHLPVPTALGLLPLGTLHVALTVRLIVSRVTSNTVMVTYSLPPTPGTTPTTTPTPPATPKPTGPGTHHAASMPPLTSRGDRP